MRKGATEFTNLQIFQTYSSYSVGKLSKSEIKSAAFLLTRVVVIRLFSDYDVKHPYRSNLILDQ